jgi:hypothetical protein
LRILLPNGFFRLSFRCYRPMSREAIVEDQLSVIDHLESDLETKLKSAQSLRQAILRQAFTG